MVRNTPANAGDIEDLGLIPGSGRSSRRAWQPTPIFLPGESHGQKSLASPSPWGCKESDTTERLTLHSGGQGAREAKPCEEGPEGAKRSRFTWVSLELSGGILWTDPQ